MGRSRSASEIGRRYARRINADRIRCAHAVSSDVDGPASLEPVAKVGRQTNIRWRLGVSSAPCGAYGPVTDTWEIAGVTRGCRLSLNRDWRGWRPVSSSEEEFFTNVTPT